MPWGLRSESFQTSSQQLSLARWSAGELSRLQVDFGVYGRFLLASAAKTRCSESDLAGSIERVGMVPVDPRSSEFTVEL